jgi:hypothetical protein
MIGDFPGLKKLIELADAIVILRIDEHLSGIHSPTGYSTHKCTIYQSLKGDISKYDPTANLRPVIRLMDPELDFATPYALGSSHLVFLMKKATEDEPTEYRTMTFKGAQVLLSPLGNEKMPEGDTLEEKIRNVIKGAIAYENQQHEKKRAFLKSMLKTSQAKTSDIEQWGVNNDLPEGVIDIRDRMLSKADQHGAIDTVCGKVSTDQESQRLSVDHIRTIRNGTNQYLLSTYAFGKSENNGQTGS